MSAKRNHSNHTTKVGREARSGKKEKIELEQARKASLVDEEIP